jgi:hypothetical protein
MENTQQTAPKRLSFIEYSSKKTKKPCSACDHKIEDALLSHLAERLSSVRARSLALAQAEERRSQKLIQDTDKLISHIVCLQHRNRVLQCDFELRGAASGTATKAVMTNISNKIENIKKIVKKATDDIESLEILTEKKGVPSLKDLAARTYLKHYFNGVKAIKKMNIPGDYKEILLKEASRFQYYRTVRYMDYGIPLLVRHANQLRTFGAIHDKHCNTIDKRPIVFYNQALKFYLMAMRSLLAQAKYAEKNLGKSARNVQLKKFETAMQSALKLINFLGPQQSDSADRDEYKNLNNLLMKNHPDIVHDIHDGRVLTD